jgi:hypothetical protein
MTLQTSIYGKKSRRNFMKTLGASVGAAGVLGGNSILSACNQVESVSGDKIFELFNTPKWVKHIGDRDGLEKLDLKLVGTKILPGDEEELLLYKT